MYLMQYKIKKEKNKLNEKHTVRPRRRRGSSTCEKLGTLAVLRISGWPCACSSSFTATLCRNRSKVKILSTAETPRVYFSEQTSEALISELLF